MSTIGTCSNCNGPVQMPDLWGGTVPPVPTCAHCGATAKDPYGPTIPMEKRSCERCDVQGRCSSGTKYEWAHGKGRVESPCACACHLSPVGVDYGRVHEFAEAHRLDYNETCRFVREALAQQPAARPPKPTECMNGCPDRQVCDHCQWPPGPDQQPAAVDRARFRKAPCYLCGYNGAGYFQPETHPCAALYHAAQQQGGAE